MFLHGASPSSSMAPRTAVRWLTGHRVNGAAQLRQSTQCSRHRLGVRVVRVVNDGHAVNFVSATLRHFEAAAALLSARAIFAMPLL